MDGCSKERVFCSFWGPKSSKHTFFEAGPQKWTAVPKNVCFAVVGGQKAQNTRSLKQGPQKVQELYKELCEDLFQELYLELYKEPCEELYKKLVRS